MKSTDGAYSIGTRDTLVIGIEFVVTPRLRRSTVANSHGPQQGVWLPLYLFKFSADRPYALAYGFTVVVYSRCAYTCESQGNQCEGHTPPYTIQKEEFTRAYYGKAVKP